MLRGMPIVAGMVLILLLSVLPSPWELPVNEGASTLIRGRLATPPVPGANGYTGLVTAMLLEGDARGSTVVATIDLGEEVSGSIPYANGDEVLLLYLGNDIGVARYAVADRWRGGGLVLLFALLSLLVIVVGGVRGARALLALCVAGVLIVRFGLPALLSGASPLLVACGIAIAVGGSTTLVTEGFTRRSTAAILGIGATLVVVGGLSIVLDRLLAFTPFAGDAELLSLLPVLGDVVDLRGIGLAAALIGTMGIVDDVAATQVAAVDELRKGAPRASSRAIAARAVSIGRAHIAAVINTLPLAYFAAALPLIVYTMLAPGDFLTRISTESVAVEIVRSMVGTIGVLLVMPLSTVAAILVGVGEES